MVFKKNWILSFKLKMGSNEYYKIQIHETKSHQSHHS
jgi:hypothetical protein